MTKLTKDNSRTGKKYASSFQKTTTSKINQAFNEARVAELRQDLVQQMSYYCAELSQTMLFEYAERIATKFLKLPINRQMGITLTRFEHRIIEEGLFEAGQDIIADMRRMTA